MLDDFKFMMAGIVLGAIIGALIDKTSISIAIGFVLGAAFDSYWRKKHPRKEKAPRIEPQKPLFKDKKRRS